MVTIHKKVWREYFEKIISGKKKLELRLADFEVNEGDLLRAELLQSQAFKQSQKSPSR